MDISTSSITGPLKLVLQVVTNQKKPVVEIYADLRKRHKLPKFENDTELQETFVQFTLINIGGIRAEDVKLELTRDFIYFADSKKLSEKPIFKDSVIPQLAPAQALHLFKIDDFELYTHNNKGEKKEIKKGFSITVNYNGPNEGINKIARLWAKLLKRHQYKKIFIFDPSYLDQIHLPPTEYD